MLETYLSKFAEQFGIEKHKVLEKGIYEQGGLGTSPLFFRENEPGFYLESLIAPCPLEKLEELFSLLMNANFLGQGTGGAAIALDGEGKFLTLSVDLPYDMEYKNFLEILEDFINYREYWKEEIQKQQTVKEGIL